MKIRRWIPVILFLLLLPPINAADQQGIVVRQAPVHAGASSAAQVVAQVRAGTRVSIFSRKGGWKEIFSEEQAIIGWVRSYQVREGNIVPEVEVEAAPDSRGFLSGLAAFSRKASGFFKFGEGSTSSGTATIGVRGLSEDEIKSAVADFEELEKLNQYASSSQRMPAFTSQGGLDAIRIPHISGKKQ